MLSLRSKRDPTSPSTSPINEINHQILPLSSSHHSSIMSPPLSAYSSSLQSHSSIDLLAEAAEEVEGRRVTGGATNGGNGGGR